ncbi:MAG: hypothetical protein SGCHY_000680 [Lobulomycetales sp.]
MTVPIPRGAVMSLYEHLSSVDLKYGSTIHDLNVESIKGLDISTTPSGFSFSGKLANVHSAPVSLQLATSLDIDISESGRLASVSATVYIHRDGNVSFSVVPDFGRNPKLALGVGDLFDDFMNQSRSKRVSVSGFRFGGSHESGHNLFQKVSVVVPLPFDQLPDLSIERALKLIEIDAVYMPQIAKVDISTTQFGLDVSTNLILPSIPFPFRFKLGYFGSDFFINNTKIVGFRLNELEMNSGSNILSVSASFNESKEDDASVFIAKLFDSVVVQDLGVLKIGICDVKFGNDETSWFDFLSLIDAHVNLDLDDIYSNMESILGSGMYNVDPMDVLSSSKVEIEAKEDHFLARVDAILPSIGFPLSAGFGYFAFDISLAERKILTISTHGCSIASNNPDGNIFLSSTSHVVLYDDSDLQAYISYLINPVLAGNSVPVEKITLEISNVVFGDSAENPLILMRKIHAPLDIPTQYISEKSVSEYAELIRIENVDIRTSGVGFDIVSAISFEALRLPKFKFSLSHASADIHLHINNQSHLLAVTGASLLADANGISVISTVNILDVDESTSGAISLLFDSTISHTLPVHTRISAGNIAFGGDSKRPCRLFSKIDVDLDLNAVLENAIQIVKSLIPPDMSEISVDTFPIHIEGLHGAFVGDGGVELDVSLSLVDLLPFSVSFQMGYLELDLSLNGRNEFASFALENLELLSNGSVSTIVRSSFSSVDTGVQLLLDDMFQCLFKPDCTSNRISLSNMRFRGVEDSSILSILSEVSYTLPYKIDLDTILEVVNADFLESLHFSQSTEWISLKGDISVVTDGLQSSVAYKVNKLPFPASFKGGVFKSSFMSTDTTDGTILTLASMEARVGNNAIEFSVRIPINKIQLPNVVNTLMERGQFSEDYFFSGLELGADEGHIINTFSKIRLPAFIPQYVLSKLRVVGSLGVYSSSYIYLDPVYVELQNATPAPTNRNSSRH